MSLELNEKYKLVKDQLRAFFRARVYRSPLYLALLKKRRHLQVSHDVLMVPLASAHNGRSIINGRFPFAGRDYQYESDPFDLVREDMPWQAWCHGFEWLPDLLALDDPKGVVHARQLVRLWIEKYGQWSPLSWRADVCGQRVINWALGADKLCASADEDFKTLYAQTLSQQADFLIRSRFRDLDGWSLLSALSSQVKLGFLLEDYRPSLAKTLQRFSETFDQQILADGGHVSRSPACLVDIMSLSLEMKQVLEKNKTEVPDGLLRAIDRMAPMIRTLRHSDGKMALFHGGQTYDIAKIDAILESSGNKGQPISDARHSGYQRLQAGQTTILMDVGLPPKASVNPHAHAGPLAMEMSYGEERMLVNCGAMIGGDPGWRGALAATAAHNTLCVNDTNCFALTKTGGVAHQDVIVTSKRFEENGQILVDACHDAYKAQFGLIFERSVYLNKTGDDLRVEDKITGVGGDTFVLSLHLHPDVQASLLQDEQAALLKLSSGSGWHLRVQGAKLEIQESIYIPGPGEMHHTYQAVIKGVLRGEGADVKWRLSKIS